MLQPWQSTVPTILAVYHNLVCVCACCSIGNRESHARAAVGQASWPQRAADQQEHVEACGGAGLLPALLALPHHLCCSCQHPLLQVSCQTLTLHLCCSCQTSLPQESCQPLLNPVSMLLLPNLSPTFSTTPYPEPMLLRWSLTSMCKLRNPKLLLSCQQKVGSLKWNIHFGRFGHAM